MSRPSRKFQESFKAVTEIDDILQRDSSLALRQFRDAVAKFNDDQSQENGEAAEFYAKASIRAFLGHVDGMGYALRRVVIKCADEVDLAIPPKKLAELMERKYDSRAESISNEERRLSTEPGIKVAVMWFPKLFGSDFKLDTGGEGWRGFKRLIDIRNEFTHPKKLEHLFPGAAFAAIHPTFMWFLVQMRDMFADCGAKLGVPQRKMEDVVLEYPYKEAKNPISRVFSDQDVSDIQDVAARTYEYVKLMIMKSSRDVGRAFDLMKKSLPLFGHGHQYAVRNAVRTLFSEVEARTGAVVFFLDAAETRGEIVLSEEERRSFSSGEIEDKLVAALTIFSREFGNDYMPQVTGELWKQFRGARFFRERLTHPKDPLSFHVDKKAVTTFLGAAEYFSSTSDALFLNDDKCLSKAKMPEGGEG